MTEPPPFTLGQMLGEELRKRIAEKERRAELDAAGFRAVETKTDK